MSILAINVDENSMPREEDHEAYAIIDSQLYEFVTQDNIEAFKSLVRQHQTEKLVTPCGNSLLHVAVRYGSDEITAYLADEFPSLITSRNFHEDTVLHLAARYGRARRTIATLADHISNASLLKETNRKGNTPLHDAVIRGHKEAVVWLVSEEPEVASYNNKTGKSPLYLAVENNNKNGILGVLLNTEGSLSMKRLQDGDSISKLPQGKSPVHAAIEQRNIGILEKIEKAKPELLRLNDKESGNSLHYASSIGYLKGVQFLLQKFRAGADESNQDGNYPIHLACKKGSVDVLKEFLNVVPYPNEFLNKKGQNILHVAAENGQSAVVWYILEQDQKLIEPLLNEMDVDGNTPLHLATQHGQSIAAFVLVRDNRVDPSMVNNEDLTPYDIAEQQSKIAVEQYEKRDEMLAEERKQFVSKNNTPVDGTLGGQVDSKDVKDGMKNSTIEKSFGSIGSQGKDKAVDPKKQDTEKASPKAYKLLNYYATMTTFSILYFYARPRKSIHERYFTSTQGKPLTKEETNNRIANLLVVAVLVAGVTFAGAIQLPQVSGKNSSSEQHHDFNSTRTGSRISTDSSDLLDSYLIMDVLALCTSLVAAVILLWTKFIDAGFAHSAVWYSSIMVTCSIYMMLWAIYCAVNIALIGSRYVGVLALIVSVVGLGIMSAQILVNLHPFNYLGLFWLSNWTWLLHAFLSDPKRKPKSLFRVIIKKDAPL